jgi:hypothetical protein
LPLLFRASRREVPIIMKARVVSHPGAKRSQERTPTDARVDDLTIEMRMLPERASVTPRSVGEALAGIEWHGDETWITRVKASRCDHPRDKN